jgi:hypothetical protein
MLSLANWTVAEPEVYSSAMAVSHSNAPTNLYKYRAAEVLEKLLVRFSQASILNDESEFKPPVTGLASYDDLRKKAIERLRAKCPGFIEQVQALPPQKAEQLMEVFFDKVESAAPTRIGAPYDALDKNFGLLSLSEAGTISKMWERYADDGRGFLIEFDPQHSWFWAQREGE